MKKLAILISILFIGGISASSYAQCTVSIDPAVVNTLCGEPIDFTASGVTTAPVLEETFNNSQLSAGWQSSQNLNFTNPCGPSLDGTPSAWFGNTATQPRELVTIPFDLQCGAQICFDMDFANDENSTNCEDPDAFDEGVHFQYSIDGVNWITIQYHEATNGYANQYYQWANYCYDLPAAGWSANTQFRWWQETGSSANWDHWGIDNVFITPYDCGNAYYYEWDGVLTDADTTIYATASHVYDVIYTNGIDDTCSTTVTVNVTPLTADITAVDPNLDCGECTDLLAALNPAPTIPGANYTYSWTATSTLSDLNVADPEACPSADETYEVLITETTTGCTATQTILITMAPGQATSSFTPSVLQGCAPLNIDFTNNSNGDTYIWDFGDGSPTTTQFEPSHTYNNPGTYTVTLTAELNGANCLDDVSTVQIEVGNNIVPTASFDYTVECGIPTITCTNTGTPGLNYTWNMGDGATYNTENVTHAYSANGSYTITFTVGDPACGTQDVITETITIVDNPITFIYNEPTCWGFNDGSATINLDNPNGTEVYTITDSLGTVVNSGGSNTANSLVAGEYTLTVDIGLGCIKDTTVTLTNPDPIDVDLDLTMVLCNGDATGIAEVSILTGAQNSNGGLLPIDSAVFNWAPNPAGIGGFGYQGADSSFNMTAGTYTLTVNDAVGCSQTIEFEITEPTPLAFEEFGSVPAMCRTADYQVGNGTVFVSAVGGAPDYDYLWENLQTGAVTGNTTWGALNPGDYQVIVEDNNGCLLIETITLDSLNPEADFTMTSPEFTAEWEGTAPVNVNFVNTSTGFSNGLDPLADTTCYWHFNYDNDPPGWVLSDSLGETFDTTYADGGTYTVCLVAINKNNCTDTTCKDIIVYDPLAFEPVNIFTPNNDGDNDEFTFYYHAQAVIEFSCTVVDRWGTTVAEFNNIADTWDGSHKAGGKVIDGVYFYVYSGVAENGETFSGQGNVTVISGN